MKTKRELQIEAENFIKNNSPKQAMEVCKLLWKKFPKDEPDAFNLYDAILTLKATKDNNNVDFNFVYNVSKLFADKEQIKNRFGWFVFYYLIDNSSQNITQYEDEIGKMSEIVPQKNLRSYNSSPCPLTIILLKLAKGYSKGMFNPNKVIECLDKLEVDFLSKEVKVLKTKKRGEIEDASDFEKYYGLLTKSLLKSERYEECKRQCEIALNELNNLHYDNALWFKMRIAICEEHLGNIDKSEHLFQEILNTNAGSEKWFLYKEISTLYFEKGDYENAWSYAVDAAFYGNEPEFMIGLFLLQARILVKLYRTDESKILAELIGAILAEKGWNKKQKYTRLLNFHNIELENLKSLKSLFREAKKFWIAERYEGLEENKGKIIYIHPRGKHGKIKSSEGYIYKFHKRYFNKRQKRLSEMANAEVSFVVMYNTNGDKVAENIKILKTEQKSLSTDIQVNSLINGTIKGITHFGIFVKLNEKDDGLLHKSNLPHDLRHTFNEKFEIGQKLNVKVIEITNKGAQLKLQ